jgi:FAD/FMN-containing dehydrogenase
VAQTDLRTVDGDVTTVSDGAIAALSEALRGRVVQPSDVDYDSSRAVWNGMIDKRPALIARCAGVADVVVAVKFAKEYNLRVAVRGGGHNVSGNAVCDDGLVIDLSQMKGIRVDPLMQTVRAEGGNGEFVTASTASNADLLWGLQGGGGNFGVVTSFEFRAFPVGPDVFLAFVLHPGTGTEAHEALQFYREWSQAAPDEISSFAIVQHTPAVEEIPAEYHDKPTVIYLAVHCGDVRDGEQALQSLRDYGTPFADLSGPTPYLDVQSFFDADYPAHELRYYWKARYLTELSTDAIELLVQLNEASPSHHSTVDVWQLGGAMARVPPQNTAFGDRSAPYLIGIEANWESPDDDQACIGWAREAFAALEPFATNREYFNFPGLYEDGEQSVRNTFGPNLGRLQSIKRKYDPDNLFRLNHNIPLT